jgi:hypothetical protein
MTPDQDAADQSRYNSLYGLLLLKTQRVARRIVEQLEVLYLRYPEEDWPRIDPPREPPHNGPHTR